MGLFEFVPFFRACCRYGLRYSPSSHTLSSAGFVSTKPCYDVYPKRRDVDVSIGGSRTRYTISYSHGHDFGVSTPLLGKTIGQLLHESTERSPDKEFIVHVEDGYRMTYHQFSEKVNRLAAGLLSLGVQRGDRVGIWGPNTLQWTLTLFASVQIGAILVNLNPAYQTRDIEFTLRKVGVKALVASSKFKTQDYFGILTEICPELNRSPPGQLRSQRLPDLETVIMMGRNNYPGAFNFDDVTNMGGVEQDQIIERCKKSLQFDDIANIQFTSGTTGNPKPTCLTHFNIVNNMHIFAHLYHWKPSTTACVPAPLFHAFGMFIVVLAALKGGKVVLPSTGFDSGRCLKAIQDERCSRWFGTPTMLIDMVHHSDLSTFDLSSWNLVVTGGSMVPGEVIRQLHSAVPTLKDKVIIYGMTEMGGAITITRPDDASDKLFLNDGRAMPWCEIKIIDPLTGEIVPVGTQGELCGRSPCNMTGYWADEEKTRQTIDHTRWLHSGDLATMDEDGYVRIVGRIKDMVVRGGENIFPAHIEQILHTHPKVEDVQVIGVPDKRMIEELCACVKLKSGEISTENEIRIFCKGKLPHYEIPRYVEFVDSFPLTSTNKVQKFKLKEELTKKLKLEDIYSTERK